VNLSSDTILDHKAVDKILMSGYSRFPVHEAGKPLAFIGTLLVKKVRVRVCQRLSMLTTDSATAFDVRSCQSNACLVLPAVDPSRSPADHQLLPSPGLLVRIHVICVSQRDSDTPNPAKLAGLISCSSAARPDTLVGRLESSLWRISLRWVSLAPQVSITPDDTLASFRKSSLRKSSMKPIATKTTAVNVTPDVTQLPASCEGSLAIFVSASILLAYASCCQ
jgi:hypothetical protein